MHQTLLLALAIVIQKRKLTKLLIECEKPEPLIPFSKFTKTGASLLKHPNDYDLITLFKLDLQYQSGNYKNWFENAKRIITLLNEIDSQTLIEFLLSLFLQFDSIGDLRSVSDFIYSLAVAKHLELFTINLILKNLQNDLDLKKSDLILCKLLLVEYLLSTTDGHEKIDCFDLKQMAKKSTTGDQFISYSLFRVWSIIENPSVFKALD